MTKIPQDSDRALRRLCELARAAFSEDLTAREEAGRMRLELTLSARPRPRRALAVAFGLAATAAVVLLALRWHQSAPSLGFRVVDETGAPRATLEHGGAGRIDFSDGSRVLVAAETSASVTSIDARGARIRLDHGHLSANIIHLPQASWSIAAGPYQVLVTGTAFDMSWSPDAQALELWLRQGSVLVKGPSAGDGLAVVAGQHVLASATSGQIVLDALVPAAASAAPVAAAVGHSAPAAPPSERPLPVVRESPRANRPATAPRSSPPEPTLTWPQALAQGEFQRILDEAERRGIDDVLAGASSADLAALGDAARYGRRNDLARRTLLAQRRRFPQTPAGKEAAFFLGTLDESSAGRDAQTNALEWYGRYLAENPAGSYGGQALGRRLVLFDSLRDRTAARETAASYLAKFPTGPYAAKAQRIVESESTQ
jgi:hypothetical protein